MNMQYKQNNRRLVLAILIVLWLDFIVIITAFYLQVNQKEPLYYQVKQLDNGKLTGKQMRMLMEPIINKQTLLNWAAEAATATYTYDQANYTTQIQETIDTYFTKEGGNSFRKALEKSGVIDQLVAKKLQVSAVVDQPPAILKAGNLFGTFTWKIQMPILVTYVSASDRQDFRYILTMSIVRLPTNVSSNGIGINQIWVESSA